MQNQKQRKTPHAFIKEGGLNRGVWVDGKPLFDQRALICNYVIPYFFGPHTKQRRIGIHTEGLLIKEIAPTAYSLPDKQTERAHIKQIVKIYFADFAAYRRADNCTDNAAVNRYAAVPNLNNLAWVGGKIIPFKNNIICPCAHNSENCAPNKNIRHSIQAHFPFIGSSAAVKHGKRKA